VNPAIVTSGFGAFLLVVELFMTVVSIVAAIKILKKAGYPGFYVLILFVPVPVYFITALIAVHDTLHGGLQTGTFSLGLGIDFLATLVSWFAYLAFAFRQWPIERDLHEALANKAGRIVSAARAAATPDDPVAAAAAPVMSGGLACSNCSTVAPRGAKFCYNCGRFVTGSN
jgi:hypothetical protein